MWNEQQLTAFKQAKTLTIEPYLADLKTFEETSPIWEVVVAGQVYVRGWNGQQTKWYQAAVQQQLGKIKLADHEYAVTFKPVAQTELLKQITAAYQSKYPGDQSLARMIAEAPTSATLQIQPQAS